MSEKTLVPYSDMERMAGAIAKSGLFGMKTQEQALALMCVAQAEGRHPGSVATEYHIIQGRPALKADTMLARFQQAGGKVEWTSYTDERVAAKFSHAQGGSVEVDWTMARAKTAGLAVKDVWKAYPRQMLRARVISEGVRTVYPGVAIGIYTPEEVQDFDEPPPRRVFDGDTGEVLDQRRRKPASKPKNTTQVLPAAQPETQVDTNKIVAAFSKLGVEQPALEFMLADGQESKPIAEWTADDVATLREVYDSKRREARGAGAPTSASASPEGEI